MTVLAGPTPASSPAGSSSNPELLWAAIYAPRVRRHLALLFILMLTACGVQAAATQQPDGETPRKVFVCKYVGKPGVDERLQTGQNPISVSVNAIPLGNVQVGSEFADAQGRSVVIAFDTGQPEPSVNDCPRPTPPTTTTVAPTTTKATTTTTQKPHETTTTKKPHDTTTTKPPHQTTTTKPAGTTTTAAATTTTRPANTTTTTTGGGTTTFPTPTPFAIDVAPLCPDGTTPEIEITFGNRPDLDGQTGTLTFSTGGSIPLVFDANGSTTIPYPASAGTGPVTLVYTLGNESVTRNVTFPEACTATTTTAVTTSTTNPTSTTGPTTSTTSPSGTTTTAPSTTTSGPTTTVPTPTTTVPFTFGAAATVCSAEVPTIVINFQNTFPELAGVTGTLTMADINGNVVSTQPLVYQPNTTVTLLYPGTSVNPDGTVADVPGWILQSNGLWVRDPSDEFLREGIQLTFTVNPTATAFVTYPPESSTCANPENPPVPGAPTTTRPPGVPPLPPTGADDTGTMAATAALSLLAGIAFLVGTRRRKDSV